MNITIDDILALSVTVTEFEVQAEGIACVNVAGMTVKERLKLGQRIAVNTACLMKARNALRAAQEEYAKVIV